MNETDNEQTEREVELDTAEFETPKEELEDEPEYQHLSELCIQLGMEL